MSYRVRPRGKGRKSLIMTAEEICTALREGRLDLDDEYHEHFGKPDPLLFLGRRMRLGDSPVFREAYALLVASQDEAAAVRRRNAELEFGSSLLHGLSGFQVTCRANLISLLLALVACPLWVGRLYVHTAILVGIVFVAAIYFLMPRRVLGSLVVLSVPLSAGVGIMALGAGLGPWFHGFSVLALILVGSVLADEFDCETTCIFSNRIIILLKYSYAVVFTVWIGCSSSLPFQSLIDRLEASIGSYPELAVIASLCLLPLVLLLALWLVYAAFHILYIFFTWLKDGPGAGPGPSKGS